MVERNEYASHAKSEDLEISKLLLREIVGMLEAQKTLCCITNSKALVITAQVKWSKRTAIETRTTEK